LDAEDLGTISSRRLSRRIGSGEIPQELSELILDIDRDAAEHRRAVVVGK